MLKKEERLHGRHFTRRQFLKGSSIFTVGAFLSPTITWASKGKILKVRSYADIKTLDPAFYTSLTEEDIMGCIYNKLIAFKPGKNWEWQLDAAESIKQVDPTHIAFTLKPGIMFTHDFGEMTAEDVKFTFERVIDPEVQSPNKSAWGPLDHVETTGKYSGIIVLKEPFEPLWNTTLPFVQGNILSQKAVQSVGGKFSLSPPCFSGPYVLKEWKANQLTILEKNPLWAGPEPDFQEIHILPIDDEKSAERAFKAGDIDFTRTSISSLSTIQKNPPPNTTVKKYPSLYYVWLGMNLDHPKLQSKKLRQAIQRAVDVPSILQAAYSGVAGAATGIIAPGLIGHREQSLVAPQADYPAAKRLLKEAGYENGISLTIDILNKTTNSTAAQVIQATLSQIGVKLDIRLHEAGSFWSLGDESAGDQWKDVQLILNRYSMVPDPYFATQWFVCDQVGVWNWERFCSEEFDRLHLQGMKEQDESKRETIYQKMQDIMEESGAYKFITHEATPVIYKNTIKPALRPDGLPLLRYFKIS